MLTKRLSRSVSFICYGGGDVAVLALPTLLVALDIGVLFLALPPTRACRSNVSRSMGQRLSSGGFAVYDVGVAGQSEICQRPTPFRYSTAGPVFANGAVKVVLP